MRPSFWHIIAYRVVIAGMLAFPRDGATQVTAQKTIAYASVGSVLLQAFAVQRVNERIAP